MNVFAEAADIIEAKGHTKGAYARDASGNEEAITEGTCFCAAGAIIKAIGVERSLRVCAEIPEIKAFAKHLVAKYPVLATANAVNIIAAWNDVPERTAAEVIAELREAAR